MKEIIKNYFTSEENGLRILVAPTGSGKTYSWMEAVCDIIAQEKESLPKNKNKKKQKERKFFFITPLKRNLPVDEIKKKLVDRQLMSKDEADKLVLMLDSNVQTIMRNFEGVYKNIEKIRELCESEEYKNLKSQLIKIRKLNDNISRLKSKNHIFPETVDLEAYKKTLEEQLAQKIEPEFRNMLSRYVKAKCPPYTKKEREKYIRETLGLGWIEKLYPGTFLREKRIVFMSLDKFLCKNTSIIHNCSYLWKDDLIVNSCVVIDEIDSTKEKIYDRIIESSQDGQDVIKLFLSCYMMLNEKDILDAIDGLHATDAGVKTMENLKDISRTIYEEYSMNHRFVMEEESNDKNKDKETKDLTMLSDFIFTSGESYTVSNNSERVGQFWMTVKDRKNIIEVKKNENKSPEAVNIRDMILRILGFLKKVQNWLLNLSINYRDSYNNDEHINQISIEDAIFTTTSRLFKAQDWQDYFNERLINMTFPNNIKSALYASGNKAKRDYYSPITEENNPMMGVNERFNYSFHAQGFSIFEFENAVHHNEDTVIRMYEVRESPEKLIADLAFRAKVLGLSATGDACTVLKNYDMEYLKNSLGVTSLMFPDEQVAPLRNFVCQMQERYRNRIELIPTLVELKMNNDVSEMTELLNGNEELAKGLLEKYRGNTMNFVWTRYMKICHAFKHFITYYDEIPLGYLMLNKIPKKNDASLDKDILFALFNAILKQFKNNTLPSDAEDIITVLAGESFAEEKRRFFKEIASTGTQVHRLIITTYNSAGAGQNMQYELCADSLEAYTSIVNVSGEDFPRLNSQGNLEVDANFIYMEKPTYIVENKMGFNNFSSFLKGLVQICSLRESGSISVAEYKSLLFDAFRFKGRVNKSMSEQERRTYTGSAYDAIYNSPDYLGAMELICEQAVGRLCRTTNKRPRIHLLLDACAAHCFRINPAHDNLSTVEFSALKQITPEIRDNLSLLKNRASRQNDISCTFIEHYLKNYRSNDLMQVSWKILRKYVIAHPTASEEEYRMMNTWQQNLYIELPEDTDRYWYSVPDTQTFKNCEVSFKPLSGYTCVSAEGAFLDSMMTSDIVRNYFESKEFATSFSSKRYILCPVVYNNIYKGALGEYAGEAICEAFGITLGEVKSEAYEFFDYEVIPDEKNGKTVCVDFKNWHVGSGAEQNQTQLNHIASKALVYGTDNVVVINIVNQGQGLFKPMSYKIQNIKITVIPALLQQDGSIDMKGIEALNNVLQNK